MFHKTLHFDRTTYLETSFETNSSMRFTKGGDSSSEKSTRQNMFCVVVLCGFAAAVELLSFTRNDLNLADLDCVKGSYYLKSFSLFLV